jgi:ketosteroid isomerase-like protein
MIPHACRSLALLLLLTALGACAERTAEGSELLDDQVLDPLTSKEHWTLREVRPEAGHPIDGTVVPLVESLEAPSWNRTSSPTFPPVGATCAANLLSEETVVGVNADYESTLRASDVDALQRILAPDFLFITSSGEVRDRQELLRSYGAREVNLRAFMSENVRVRFRGHVGILTADITKEGDYLAGPRAGAVFTGRYRFTRVYACGSEGWQLVSTHESQLSL